ncbi:MAG: hypothetical protein HND52_15280 [Ignavibacteriae bacterium]|jgi:hypothetical protein|nr:hypothetical protein [Ignavibacteriota bacterium]NOG99317.1 hypothetical protein [Ignavibacteriota bacterium]
MSYILKKIFTIIFVVHLLCGFNYASIAEKDKKTELYEIYSVVLDSMFFQLDDIHISGRTTKYALNDSTGEFTSLELFIENYLKIRDVQSVEALKNFYFKQNERFYFEDMFTTKAPVTIVPIDKIKNFAVHKEHPKFKNLLFFSTIGLNKEKTEAIFHVIHYEITSKWIHLKKYQNEWNIILVN